MTFELVVPLKSDDSAIASTHLRAMADNNLLHAQFPNTESLEFLTQWLCKDTLSHINDAHKGVFVARDTESGILAGFIKWNVQQPRSGVQQDHDEELPASCRREYLDSYAELTETARKTVLGDGAHYHVTFLCTDPKWAGRGAATQLLRHVQTKAATDNLPIVLESTIPAVSFYERLGFTIRKGLEMLLPPKGGPNVPTELYAEKTMIWTPPARPD